MATKHGLALRYAAGSDVGEARSHNEDSAFASPRLLAVADGMGGHAHGEVASAVVIGVLAELDDRLRTARPGEVDPPAALAAVVARALRRLTELAAQDFDLTLMGSTLTALLWDGTGFGLAHVGDSRGYLLREGVLHQITKDHTLVQSLVDDGRITEAEAALHPRRSMVTRALQAGGSAEPDLTPLPAQVGDRLLLCSDGVTCVVGPDRLRDTLGTATSPEAAVRKLIEEAIQLDSPDNISCVVADVVVGPIEGDVQIVGSAAEQPELSELPVKPQPSRLARWARHLRPY
ncbi:MAG TPA: protein phosphatase 2C domain-containing protein [Pseudonocardiaceae bacterium]|nr:protein phosphatase 2C domain-containing protein [Pseudonocardiaceae bacterium]